MPLSNKGYSEGTYVTLDMPFGQIVKGKALCSDGKLRAFTITGMPDSMFSIPARVAMKGKSVTGFIHFEKTGSGSNHHEVICFSANAYGKNADLLPPWSPGE